MEIEKEKLLVNLAMCWDKGFMEIDTVMRAFKAVMISSRRNT